MNLKKMRKSLIGVAFLSLFVIVYFLVTANTVQAEAHECSEEEKNRISSGDIADRFGVRIVGDSSSGYYLTRNCNEPTYDLQVTAVNSLISNPVVGQSLTCTGGQPNNISLSVNTAYAQNPSSAPDYGATDQYAGPIDLNTGITALKAQLTVSNIPASNDPNACHITEISFATVATYATTSGGSASVTQPGLQEATLNIQHIDCSNSYADGSFEANFCKSKNRAASEGHSFNGNYAKQDMNFKCDYDIDHIPAKVEDLEGDDYFVNLHSLYASKTTRETAKYTYNYAASHKVEVTTSCEITCEEAVDVEYGPPVASRAGMCFEYKVRVTSRVSCGMSQAPTPPTCQNNYCTPYPHCTNGSNSVFQQGGPSEQFDACVKSCDGGKYSKKCSNKCYQEIYGSISANAKVTSIYYDDLFASKLTVTGDAIRCEGKYDGNGSSVWWTNSGSEYTAGRWYCENSGSWHSSNARSTYTVRLSDGFFRHNLGGGAYCNDSCSWLGCSGNVYLNPDNLQSDCDANTEAYNDLVELCNSKASCSTTTAEFTITADYKKKGSSTVTQINFPYNNQKDTVTHTGDMVSSTVDQNNTTLLKDYPTDNTGMLGCYLSGDDRSNLYRSTWGFPGTWLNMKTGEISYIPKDSSQTSWFSYTKRFCVPGDAANVNVRWWAAYRHKELVANNLMHSVSVTDTNANAACPVTTTTNSVTNCTSSSVNESDITWNIHAKTKNFGYFDWTISMDCFYAINDDPLCTTDSCTTSTSSTTDNPCSGDPDNYRVHSTDQENMFPSEDGSTLGSTSDAGRLVGYNWSKYAINDKNPEYASNPPKYMEKLQSEAASGSEIYNANNLDYEFILMPQTLRQMRKDGAGSGGSNYTSFSDSGFSFSSGVGRYKSDKIRALDGNNKIPNGPELNCNNMLHYGSSLCDSVHNS